MLKIVAIGSGNVASHLIPELYKMGCNITQVLSLNTKKAQALARKVKAKATNQLTKLDKTADVYLLMVPDDHIKQVSDNFPFTLSKNQIICHTSGSVTSLLLQKFPSYGVIYPLQTFSKSIKLEYATIPFFITANSKTNERKLKALAKYFSKNVYVITDAERKIVHLSAVVASNFVNHLLVEASSVLEKEDLDFAVLKPLIKETIRKGLENHPATVQTGPAIRKDKKVIKEHLSMLKDQKGLQRIYRLISKEIQSTHENSR